MSRRRLIRVGVLPTAQFYTIMTSTHNTPRRWNRRGERIPGERAITPEEEAAGFGVGLVEGDATGTPSAAQTVRALREQINAGKGSILDAETADVLHSALSDLDVEDNLTRIAAVTAYLAALVGDRETVQGILDDAAEDVVIGDSDASDDVGFLPLLVTAAAPTVASEVARRDTPQGVVSEILRLQSRVDKLRARARMPAATWKPVPKLRPRPAAPPPKKGLVALGEGMSALAKAIGPREAPPKVGSFGPGDSVGAFTDGEQIDSVTPDRGLWAVDTDGYRQRI